MTDDFSASLNENIHPESSTKLSSRALASLIVDAIEDAGLIKNNDVIQAIAIAAEEIEVRKALGDY